METSERRKPGIFSLVQYTDQDPSHMLYSAQVQSSIFTLLYHIAVSDVIFFYNFLNVLLAVPKLPGVTINPKDFDSALCIYKTDKCKKRKYKQIMSNLAWCIIVVLLHVYVPP